MSRSELTATSEHTRLLAIGGLRRRLAWAELLHWSVLLGIILVGGWLRLTALDRQSLWFDEADVVVRAQQSLGAVLHSFVQPGENGPLYNLMLHIWVGLVGSSEKAVRFPSAVAGLLSLPLIYLLGARAFRPRVGLLAAGLLAISPYHVWYSQEAKMYAIAVLLTLASTLLLVEALSRNSRLTWIGYVVVTTLAFYVHVTTVLIFVAQSLFVLLTWRRWPGRHRAWLISVAALTLPYLPIGLWAGRVVLGHATTWQPKVTLWEMVRITGTKFAVNRADLVTESRGSKLYVALALVGLFAAGFWGIGRWPVSDRRRHWVWLMGLLVVLPLLGFYLLTFRQPLFNDRYLIMSLPAYLMLVALGVRTLERRVWPLAPLVMVALIAYAWVPLRDVNRSTLSQKEDWRTAYGTVVQLAQPDDLLLIHPGYLRSTYDYYAQRITGLARLSAFTIPSFQTEGFDAHQMAAFVRRAAPGSRVWLIESPDRVAGEDPNGALEKWLASYGPPLHRQVFNGVVIALYRLPPPGCDPPPPGQEATWQVNCPIAP